jgi:hypothetical protein
MRKVVLLVGGYAAVSVLTLGAAALFRHDAAMVTTAVWVRGTVVAVASIVTLLFAVRAVRGDRRMLVRLRVVTAVMLVAITVIVALPGAFPVWFRLEQALCGLILLPAVVLINRRRAVHPGA